MDSLQTQRMSNIQPHTLQLGMKDTKAIKLVDILEQSQLVRQRIRKNSQLLKLKFYNMLTIIDHVMNPYKIPLKNHTERQLEGRRIRYQINLKMRELNEKIDILVNKRMNRIRSSGQNIDDNWGESRQRQLKDLRQKSRKLYQQSLFERICCPYIKEYQSSFAISIQFDTI